MQIYAASRQGCHREGAVGIEEIENDGCDSAAEEDVSVGITTFDRLLHNFPRFSLKSKIQAMLTPDSVVQGAVVDASKFLWKEDTFYAIAAYFGRIRWYVSSQSQWDPWIAIALDFALLSCFFPQPCRSTKQVHTIVQVASPLIKWSSVLIALPSGLLRTL